MIVAYTCEEKCCLFYQNEEFVLVMHSLSCRMMEKYIFMKDFYTLTALVVQTFALSIFYLNKIFLTN
jgi:hypothetical protein